MQGVRIVLRTILTALAGIMAWGEPHDYEDDDDPLLSSGGSVEASAYFW
jgi:hypothetical protein